MRRLTTEEAQAVREFVETLPVKLREHAEDFIALEMTVEEVQVFVNTARRSRDEWWTSAVDEEVVEQIQTAADAGSRVCGIEAGKSHVTTVRVNLPEQQRAALVTEFSGMTDLVFPPVGRGDNSDHPMAKAIFTIASVQVRRMIPRSSRVLEVGAKPEHAVVSGATVGSYLGCTPVMDAHDAQRETVSQATVRRMFARKGVHALKPDARAMADAYLHKPGSVFVKKRVQEVVWPADIVVSIEANYDIPMADMPRIMHRCGAKAWFGTMVRCSDATVVVGKRSGLLSTIGFEYRIDCDRDAIAFNFRSPSRAYKHKLSVYREYMTYTHRVFRCQGAKYIFKVLPQTVASQLFFGVFRVPDREYVDPPLAYVETGNAGMLRIQTGCALLQAKCHDVVMPETFDVSEESFSRVLQKRMLEARKIEEGELYRIVRSTRIGTLVNGVRVRVDSPFETNLVKPVAVLVELVAQEMFKRGDEVTENAMKIIRAGGFKKSGLWTTMKDALWQATSGPGSLVGLVSSRVKRLAMADVPTLQVERLPCFRAVKRDTVFECDTDVCQPSKCVCEELGEARAMVRGDRGGLSQDEHSVLRAYVEHLEQIKCFDCEFSQGTNTDLIPTSSCVDEKSSAASDSGYGSGGDFESGSVSDASDDSVEFYDASEEVCCGLDGTAEERPVAKLKRSLSGGQQVTPPSVGFVRDSVEELISVMEQQMLSVDSETLEWSKVFEREGWDGEVLIKASDGRLDHCLLKIDAGFVVGAIGSDKPHAYQRVYDYKAGVFRDLLRLPSGQAFYGQRCSSQVYTHSRYEVRNQPSLIAFCKRVLRDPSVGPLTHRISFVNGVAGCGKTTDIVCSYGAKTLYLSATRASVESVRKTLFHNSPEGLKYCRTYDSAAIHGVPEDVVRVEMDELCMAPAGLVLAILHGLGSIGVRGWGDYKQITYIPFVAGLRLRSQSLEAFCDVTMKAVQYRYRVQVAAAVLPYYGLDSGLCVCYNVPHLAETEHGLERHVISSVTDIPFEKGVKYITFSHTEKAAVSEQLKVHGILESSKVVEVEDEMNEATSEVGRAGTSMANTVHEVQGETYDKVVIVRLTKRTKPGAIYHSKPHVLVALTRAKKLTSIYTASDENDEMTKCFEASKKSIFLDLVRKASALHMETCNCRKKKERFELTTQKED